MGKGDPNPWHPTKLRNFAGSNDGVDAVSPSARVQDNANVPFTCRRVGDRTAHHAADLVLLPCNTTESMRGNVVAVINAVSCKVQLVVWSRQFARIRAVKRKGGALFSRFVLPDVRVLKPSVQHHVWTVLVLAKERVPQVGQNLTNL